MTITFSTQTKSLFLKEKGIIDDCSVYQLSKLVGEGCNRFYFYKYNMRNLIEISCSPNNISVHEFQHTKIGVLSDLIKDGEERYKYFVATGLQNQTFLYDVELKVAIRGYDFIPMNTPFLRRNETAFIISDLPLSSNYVVMPQKVYFYQHIKSMETKNNCLLSMHNFAEHISPPKGDFSVYGSLSTLVISGLMSGISIDFIEKMELDADEKDFRYKFDVNNLKKNDLSILLKFINTDKLSGALYSTAPCNKEFSENTVNLSRLFEMGLDNFMKSMTIPRTVVDVNIDIPCNIKSMYITNGCAFISGGDRKEIDILKAWLNSENIVEVMYG